MRLITASLMGFFQLLDVIRVIRILGQSGCGKQGEG